jgi:aminocarboxymuconate-semialdehyde decarboxylase
VTVVDIHAHYLPRFFVEEARAGDVFGMRVDGDKLFHPEGWGFPVHPTFNDLEAKLEEMDTFEIDISIMSGAPPLFFYNEPADEVVDFTRRVNDSLAEWVAEDERLYAIAGLPLQDPDAATAELERAVEELGMLGAHIGTNCESTPLDAPEYDALFSKAEELGVPLVIHPYYVGPKPGLGDWYLVNSMGNPLDTTIATVRLIHSGALDRHPDLRIALMHGGGFLPYQIGRFDHAYDVRQEPKANIDRRPSEYLERFWMDTITHADRPLEFLRDLIGPERLVLGTDLPFDMADAEPVERLRRVGVDLDATTTAAAELFGVETWSNSPLEVA